MKASDYLQDGETVYRRVGARQEKPKPVLTGGSLVATGKRLIFSNGKEIRDIRFGSVNEIRITPPTYINKATHVAVVLLSLGILAHFAGQEQVGNLPWGALTAGLFAGGIFALALIVYYAKWMLVIITPTSKYVYQSSDEELAEIPHVVRGAEGSNDMH